MERCYFERQRKCKKLLKVIFDHHIVRKSQICSLSKLTSKELYLTLVDTNTVKPAAQDYFENLFESFDFNWKKIYIPIQNITLDTKARMFQYKVLLNKSNYSTMFLLQITRRKNHTPFLYLLNC